MVTGLISLRVPEYSPISSSVSVVRRTSSSFHCRAETVLVTRISVVVPDLAIAPAPTIVLPAPQGSTTTPEPPCQNPSTACCWYGRIDHGLGSSPGVRGAATSLSAIGCFSPST
jgi:hypothetical protein